MVAHRSVTGTIIYNPGRSLELKKEFLEILKTLFASNLYKRESIPQIQEHFLRCDFLFAILQSILLILLILFNQSTRFYQTSENTHKSLNSANFSQRLVLQRI